MTDVCHVGKEAYDSLYYIARKQGKLEFFKKQHQDDDKAFHMYQKYWEQNPQKKLPKTSVVRFEASVRATPNSAWPLTLRRSRRAAASSRTVSAS